MATNRIGLLTLILILWTVGLLLFQETGHEPLLLPPPDGCQRCHQPRNDPSRSHPAAILGCNVCHLGAPFARKKEQAHLGLVRNPGSLHVARRTCGQANCHPELPQRVENSLMATNRGILLALQKFWPHSKAETVPHVRALISEPGGNTSPSAGTFQSPALDHYGKMCGGCHLWKPRYPQLGEIGQRGGGCSDCHLIELQRHDQDLRRKQFDHPELTTRIPSANCLKCHNRSARIGLSYFGRFESEGYGTPYANGAPGPRRLSGGRFYMELPADVHHQKAGLDCIDCHTERGVMGDGQSYDHQEEQTDITCEACHRPEFQEPFSDKERMDRLIRLNRKQPKDAPRAVAVSPGGSPLYHLFSGPHNKMVLRRKRDGVAISFQRLELKGAHAFEPHQRLACQACHSRWTPQCYGCHELRFMDTSQRSWLTGQTRAGRWEERRSYLRFRDPCLGLWQNGQIGPFAPGCQVFADTFDTHGHHDPQHTFRSLVMAGFDPHTTSLETPDCIKCHLNPKVLGLGQGALKVTSEKLIFEPLYDARKSGLKTDFALDAFVTAEGAPLQMASREQSRPFNREELKRITTVALCLPCHDQYDDAIYQNFHLSWRRFMSGAAPCKAEIP